MLFMTFFPYSGLVARPSICFKLILHTMFNQKEEKVIRDSTPKTENITAASICTPK